MPSPASPASESSTCPSPPRRQKSRKKLYWILGASVVLLGVWGARMVAKNRDKAARVTTEKAIVKTITQIVSATGKIQPETEVKISPEVAGEIVELPFREGAAVKKGELIARIKPDNYRFAVDQREADLAAARATAVESRVHFEKAEQDFQRSQALFDRALIADSVFAADRATYESARANYESAQASIRRSEGLLSQAQDQLQKTTIFAPIDGTVSSRTAEVGERVVATNQFAGTEIMRVADLSNMEVRVNINENDIVNVKVGDRARIAVDAFPDRKFDAVVKEIGSAAKVTGQNTQEEVTNFQVKIGILEKAVSFRPGMSANADIETQTAENVVAVPIQSVVVRARDSQKTLEQLAIDRAAKNGELGAAPRGAAGVVDERRQKQTERSDRENIQRVVFVREGDVVKLVPVETGISDTTHFEIKAGVKAGDEVVSGSYATLTRTLIDGMKVQLEKPKKAPGK
jgi:HlyD family secretion protein